MQDTEVARQRREHDIKKRARRDGAGAKLDAVVPRVTEIDLQIRWHRRSDLDRTSSRTHTDHETEEGGSVTRGRRTCPLPVVDSKC
jgi:hypothetical protein